MRFCLVFLTGSFLAVGSSGKSLRGKQNDEVELMQEIRDKVMSLNDKIVETVNEYETPEENVEHKIKEVRDRIQHLKDEIAIAKAEDNFDEFKTENKYETPEENVEDKSLVNPYEIYGHRVKQVGNDPDSVVLSTILNTPNQNEVEIKVANGAWVRDIYFPDGSTVPQDSKIQITCNSGWNVNANLPDTTRTGGWRKKRLSYGQSQIFILVGGVWQAADDGEEINSLTEKNEEDITGELMDEMLDEENSVDAEEADTFSDSEDEREVMLNEIRDRIQVLKDKLMDETLAFEMEEGNFENADGDYKEDEEIENYTLEEKTDLLKEEMMDAIKNNDLNGENDFS